MWHFAAFATLSRSFVILTFSRSQWVWVAKATKRPKSSRLRALHFGSGGGIRTPDLRVMRKFPRFRKEPKLRRVTDLRRLGIGSGWVPLVQSDPRVTPPLRYEAAKPAGIGTAVCESPS